jgi:inosine/xanthosine triphosphate pyrophosphatase family protein
MEIQLSLLKSKIIENVSRLSLEEKNKVGHRGKAVLQMVAFFK